MRQPSVSASATFGVVSPASVSTPCTPRNSTSAFSVLMVRSAKGPTSASEGVRNIPPESTICSHPFSCNVSAMLVELVMNVSEPRSRLSASAICQVVVPAEKATVSPSLTKPRAARAITRFSVRFSFCFWTKCGSAAVFGTGTAPPCTLRSMLRAESSSRSRLTVMSETPSPRLNAATETLPARSSSSRSACCRLSLSITDLLAHRLYTGSDKAHQQRMCWFELTHVGEAHDPVPVHHHPDIPDHAGDRAYRQRVLGHPSQRPVQRLRRFPAQAVHPGPAPRAGGGDRGRREPLDDLLAHRAAPDPAGPRGLRHLHILVELERPLPAAHLSEQPGKPHAAAGLEPAPGPVRHGLLAGHGRFGDSGRADLDRFHYRPAPNHRGRRDDRRQAV